MLGNNLMTGLSFKQRFYGFLLAAALAIGVAKLYEIEKNKKIYPLRYDQEHTFVLDVRKSGSGKFYNSNLPNIARDSHSTRKLYYNFDSNEKTIEQYVEYEPLKRSSNPLWIAKKFFIMKGYKPFNGNIEDFVFMTPEQQKKINKEFLKEDACVEREKYLH